MDAWDFHRWGYSGINCKTYFYIFHPKNLPNVPHMISLSCVESSKYLPDDHWSETQNQDLILTLPLIRYSVLRLHCKVGQLNEVDDGLLDFIKDHRHGQLWSLLNTQTHTTTRVSTFCTEKFFTEKLCLLGWYKKVYIKDFAIECVF